MELLFGPLCGFILMALGNWLIKDAPIKTIAIKDIFNGSDTKSPLNEDDGDYL